MRQLDGWVLHARPLHAWMMDGSWCFGRPTGHQDAVEGLRHHAGCVPKGGAPPWLHAQGRGDGEGMVGAEALWVHNFLLLEKK